MRKICFILAITAISLFITACGNKGANENELRNERDSLQSINEQQQMLLNDMTSKMAEISLSLDTIAMHENMIIRRVDESGNPLSRNDLKAKLSALSDIIKNKREKIAALEKDMIEGKSSIAQLRSVIAYLNVSLEQKEAEIQKLRAEVDSKNFSIARLTAHVTNLKDTVASVRQENEDQRRLMERQKTQHEASINEVYYIVGKKDYLINIGVLSKSSSIFKKSKLNIASIDKSLLIKGDKRVLKKISINGKSPKVLSEQPEGTFSMEKTPSSSILTILDPEKFWSTNNKILVVMVK